MAQMLSGEMEGPLVDPDWLATICLAREPHGIAADIAKKIEAGELLPGSRLPTVRMMAAKLSVSPSTVASAWARLRSDGLVETRRRGGTYVLDVRHSDSAYEQPVGALDLSQASPDPLLQPSLEAALNAGLHAPKLNAADLEYIIEPLRQFAKADWPFDAQQWMIAGASSESILLAVSAVTTAGDLVAVEQPTTPRLLRILSLLGVTPIPVEWDEQGPSMSALSRAVLQEPVAFVYQPHAHVPLGRAVSPERMAEIAEILAMYPNIKIIEDDPLGPLAIQPAASLGKWLPEQTLLVRSYCKAFGLDLRSSIIGGNADHIKSLRLQRSHGLGMTSRILQGALLHLLMDPTSIELTRKARQTYARRREALRAGLEAQGLDIIGHGSEGLMLWLPVNDEARVAASLAERGVLVGLGSRYSITAGSTPHIAIGTGLLARDPRDLNRTISLIAEVVAGRDQGHFD
jgi:DNA-binding transcriptional MocR family regulator